MLPLQDQTAEKPSVQHFPCGSCYYYIHEMKQVIKSDVMLQLNRLYL